MHHKTSLIPSIALLPVVFALACGSKDEDTANPYCAPAAHAGEDQSVTLGATVDLDATQVVDNDDGTTLYSGYATKEADGGPCDQRIDHAFLWSFMSVPVDSAIDSGGLTDNDSATASVSSFTPDVPGTYVLSLEVCDEVDPDNPCSPPSIVAIDVSTTDAIPVAEAGEAVMVDTGERADLDGSESYDPDGEELEFAWSLGSTPSCSELTSEDLYNATTATPTLICDCEGIYVVSLAVSDGQHWSDPDHVKVTCNSGNQAPLADAGDSMALAPCTDFTFELNGFGSYDPDGDELQYQWSLVSVPAGSLADDGNFNDPTLGAPEFSWDVPGEYTFQLQVGDGEYWSAPDVVTYTLSDISENTAPTANAGEPDSAEVEADCTSASYVWTCGQCDPVDFDVDGTLSYDEDGDPLSYEWTSDDGASILSPEAALTEVVTPPVDGTFSTGQVHTFDIDLTVADCATTSTDTVTLTVNCVGVSATP